ncbi:unnamed protein product [Urochloa decumbens]|uniref:Bowman-Birk serine protease inhibitors family domain-containing protein n=1 Tax=Urochloa decumbens TaxID=240449 RepID=A0ABC9CCP8_9POAL
MMGTSRPIVLATLVVIAGHAAAAAAAATARPSGPNPIRLPTSAAGDGRPWKCCDFVVRDPKLRPPRWQCNDVVKECSTKCRDCEKSPAGDGFVCRDWIVSPLEPPVCTPRPWECCDAPACVSWDDIPTCWCADNLAVCPRSCKNCELVQWNKPPVYRCTDQFHGYPGPKCSSPYISSKGKGN